MKKLLSLVLVVVLCSACAVSFAATPDVVLKNLLEGVSDQMSVMVVKNEKTAGYSAIVEASTFADAAVECYNQKKVTEDWETIKSWANSTITLATNLITNDKSNTDVTVYFVIRSSTGKDSKPVLLYILSNTGENNEIVTEYDLVESVLNPKE